MIIVAFFAALTAKKYRLSLVLAVIRPPQAARMPQRPKKNTISTMPVQPRMEPLTSDLQRLQEGRAHWR